MIAVGFRPEGMEWLKLDPAYRHTAWQQFLCRLGWHKRGTCEHCLECFATAFKRSHRKARSR